MSKKSILIVEDEAIIAYDLATIVQRVGYDVVAIISTGEKAVELARQHRPELMLMDIQLAGKMDGIAAAQEIKRECNLPVLFMTANSDLAKDERAQQAGVVGTIMKPLDHKVLVSRLKKHSTKDREAGEIIPRLPARPSVSMSRTSSNTSL